MLKENHLYRVLYFVLISLCILFSFSPMGKNVERYLGLNLLFQWRGSIHPPQDIAIVGIDEKTALDLNVSPRIEEWPRKLHAHLLLKLKDFGVRWVVFYLDLRGVQSKIDDEALDLAIAQTNNVILLKYIRRAVFLSNSTSHSDTTKLSIKSTELDDHHVQYLGEQEILPLRQFRQSAIETVGFILPDTNLIDYVPLFRNKPTGFDAQLPLLLLQLDLDAQNHILSLLNSMDIESSINVEALEQSTPLEFANLMVYFLDENEQLFRNLKNIINQIYDDKMSKDLIALLLYYRQYREPKVLNFYGPLRTISTFSYQEVLNSSPGTSSYSKLKQLLSDRTVFVGSSELLQTEQKNTFQTYFTQEGVDLSGVEIAATMFGNLKTDDSIKVMTGWQQIMMMVVWTILLLYFANRLNLRRWITFVLMLSGGCLFVLFFLFSHYNLWAPYAMMLFVITPLTMIYIFWMKFERQRQEHELRFNTLSSFVPEEILGRIKNNQKTFGHLRRTVDGICLITDIEGYTAFSEKYSPDELHRILNAYYHDIVKVIDHHRGKVMNIVGDGLLAIWSSETDIKKDAINACLAALDLVKIADNFEVPTSREIKKHVDDIESNKTTFHQKSTEIDYHNANGRREEGENDERILLGEQLSTPSKIKLKTCVGLHSGKFSVGNLGSLSHLEYAPVGDTVNTTSRIEAANRHLKTRILISHSIYDCVFEHFDFHDCGVIPLKGKKQAVRLYELKNAKKFKTVLDE